MPRVREETVKVSMGPKDLNTFFLRTSYRKSTQGCGKMEIQHGPDCQVF